MKFIGRKREMEKLESEYSRDSRDSSFVVIYGRRRVGKTTLIKEFLKNKTAFYFLATEEIESQSMKRLAGVVARTTKNRLLQNATFTDWLDLFQVIADYEPEKKKVLVIDEFPYLVKTNSAFPSVLQNAWDEILKDNNFLVYIFFPRISHIVKGRFPGEHGTDLFMLFSLLSRFRYKTVEDENIEMFSRFVQFLLALDGPCGCSIMVQTSAKLPGQDFRIMMIVCHKIRLGHEVQQQILQYKI